MARTYKRDRQGKFAGVNGSARSAALKKSNTISAKAAANAKVASNTRPKKKSNLVSRVRKANKTSQGIRARNGKKRGITPAQRRRRNRLSNAVQLGGAALAAAYLYSGTTSALSGATAPRTRNTPNMMSGVRRSRSGVYNITTAKAPRRGYR